MKNPTTILGIAALVLAPACATKLLPQQQLMDTQSAIASTEELGGDEDPDAKLHLQYAREQLEAAKRLMAAGEEEEARRMLDRAEADAELALALARTDEMRAQSKAAWSKVDELRSTTGTGETNAGDGEAADGQQPTTTATSVR